jgi:hypothetical protein
MGWLGGTIVVLVALGFVWAALLLYGQRHWQRRTEALLSELAAQRTVPLAVIDSIKLTNLPLPVQRYLRAALADGQLPISQVTMAHAGTFNMGEAGDNWKPFTSRQVVTTRRPGFVWDGTIRMAPGLPVRVHDAYVAGQGVLVPAILGLFKLTELRGTGAIAEGEAMRWLAEAAWYPTALLPGAGVTWTAIDDRSALASLRDGAVAVALTFQFGSDDLIASVRAEARHRSLAGELVATPWEGRWSDYRRQAGLLVPMTGEVSWILPEGPKPYWRGKITAIDYQFAG